METQRTSVGGEYLKPEDSSEDLFISAMESLNGLETTSPQSLVDKTISENGNLLLLPAEDEVPLDDDNPTSCNNIDFPTVGSAYIKPPNLPAGNFEESANQAPLRSSESNSAIMSHEEELERKSGDEFVEISISEPQKVGEGMSSYMVYKISTKSNMKCFQKSNFSVMRRFSDFLGLHEKLLDKHLHSGVFVPPAPEKSVIGMTKIKMSNSAEQGSSAEFIEKRRTALERYLNRNARHPVIRNDTDFRDFLERDSELPKATSTSALSSAGMMRLFNKVGETVNKMAFKMEENDSWFEEKAQQIENLDNQLRKLHMSVEALTHHRRELSYATDSLAKSTALLSNCEEHAGLSHALSRLAEVEDKMEAIHSEQAHADFYVVSELLKDYIGLLGAVKESFHERVKTYQLWQHAEATLAKKRENKARLELAGKSDKISQAKEEVVEWEAKVERGQESFENISSKIKSEMKRFDCERIVDFRNMMISYLETLIMSQEKIIKAWESFLPEAKAIA